MKRKPDPRQMDLFAELESPVTAVQKVAMYAILQQYHDGAVAGDNDVQKAATQDIWELSRQLTGQAMEYLSTIGDAYDMLFQATTAKAGEDFMFGQAFQLEVDLGPCRALLTYRGFKVLGSHGSLKAVDSSPFISETGFRSFAVTEYETGCSGHNLQGRTPLEYILEHATYTSRDRATGELQLVPWKPFDYRTHCERQVDVAA